MTTTNTHFYCNTIVDQPMTCAAVVCTSISASGTFSCGTNAMTCGDFKSLSITASGTFSAAAITSSGTFTCGSNAMTCGALNCSSANVTGTLSCGSNSATCGALSCGGAITSSSTITALGYTIKNSGATSYTILSAAGDGFGDFGHVAVATEFFPNSSAGDIILRNVNASGRILLGANPASSAFTQVTASSFVVDSRLDIGSSGHINFTNTTAQFLTSSAIFFEFFKPNLAYDENDWLFLGKNVASNESLWMNFNYYSASSAHGSSIAALGIWGANSAIQWDYLCRVGIGSNQVPGTEVLTVGGNVSAGKYFSTNMSTGGTYPVKVLIPTGELMYDNTSSIKYKTNVQSFTDDGFLYKLNPVSFEYKTEPNVPRIGLIAEDVQLIDASLMYVVYDKDGAPDGIMYDRFVVPLIACVQAQKARIDALEARIAALETPAL